MVLACIAVLTAVACHSPGPATIAVVLDADGQEGATFAAFDVNAAGGIGGRPLELRLSRGASSTTAKIALTAAEALSSDPSVLAVVGHTNSSASLAAAQVYNQRHIVQIAPTSTAPMYRDSGPYSFRMVPGDDYQAGFLAGIVAADSDRERVAVLYVNDDYGRGLHAMLATRLAASGVTPVYEAPYAERAGFTDIGDLVHAIVRSRARLLVWLGRPPELGQLSAPLRAAVPGVRVIASDGFSALPTTEGSAALFAGVRYVRFVNPSDSSPALRDLAQRFRAAMHREPSDQFVLSYEAVRLLAEAIRSVGHDREAIRRYLAGLGTSRPAFPGAAGPVMFDSHGEPPAKYFLKTVAPFAPMRSSP